MTKLELFCAALLGLGVSACPAPNPSPIDSGVPPSLDLTGSRQGAALAVIDFDGDGVVDKLVGAPFASSEGHRGVALVYRGLPKGAFSFTPRVLTGGDSFGAAVLATGDLDGDGVGDYAISALHGDGTSGMTGAVTLFRGGQSGSVLATLSAGGPGAKFGYALAAGDFDADGHLDLAVGAPFESPSADLYQAGAVFVFFGPAFTRVHALPADANNRGLGWSLAAGDVSGDGVADLVVGASGAVLGFHGGAGFAPQVAEVPLRLKSAAADFGKALTVLDDWTGDGIGELAIGAPTAAAGSTRDVGAFFVVRGAAGARSLDLSASPPPADLVALVKGAAAFDRLGYAMTSVADLDGDRHRELLVSAPLSDVAVNDLAGKVYLFKSGSPLELTGATSFSGAERSGWFGAALAPTTSGGLFVGSPRSQAETGAVQLLDLATGQPVKSGSSGGSAGSANCHCDETGECHC